MEVQNKKIREQFTVAELAKNFNEIIIKINKLVEDNNYVLKANGEEIIKLDLKSDFNNLSKNARKNIAKRLYLVDKTYSIRAINILFLVAFRTRTLDQKYSLRVSLKEQLIQGKRKAWVTIRDQAAKLLEDYKNEKGDFYKQKVV